MIKIKKIHKITILFILIFIIGIYSFFLYINNTIDYKKDNIQLTEPNGFNTQTQQVLLLP